MKLLKGTKRIVVTISLSLCAAGLFGASSIYAASNSIPKSLYKYMKGKWYTQASSGGFDVKFTKTKVNYYNRNSGELVYSGKIKKVKKIKSGEYKGRYRIVFKNEGGVASFINTDKKAKGFDYYSGSKGYRGFSGSAGLTRGKWGKIKW